MLYFNSGMQIFGKALGKFLGDPVLPERGLNKDPYRYDEKQQRQKKPQYYFFEFFQGQVFDLVKIVNPRLCKFSAGRLYVLIIS